MKPCLTSSIILKDFNSHKLLLGFTAQYESANRESQNTKLFNAKLHARAIIIGYLPVTFLKYQDEFKTLS